MIISAATIITIICSTARSRFATDSTISRPSPGQPNTDSTTAAAATIAPTNSGVMVTSGKSAFGDQLADGGGALFVRTLLAGFLEKDHAELVLKFPDLGADGRLGIVEPLGSLAEALQFGYRTEGLKLGGIHLLPRDHD